MPQHKRIYMASLYKNNGIWYIAVLHNGTRKSRSLKTKDIKVAKYIKSYAENIILHKLEGFIKNNAILSFSELVDHLLKVPHSWSSATSELNKYILTSHLDGKSLPKNPTSRAIHIRHINQCWNWVIKKNLVALIRTPLKVFKKKVCFLFL